jgi:hypothetical protein
MRFQRHLFAVLLLVPSAAWPQGNPVGPEFRVNTYTTSNQGFPSVARAGSGDFVVVWNSLQYGGGNDVFGQRYAGSGVPLGPEFCVNTTTSNEQLFPSVAADSSGNFVVVWQSYQDGSGYGIFGQRYAATGAPLGAEFRVNTYTTNTQLYPAVAADASGNFVVVWQSYPTFQAHVAGQRFASSGIPLGPEFRVNTSYPFSGDRPSIASDASGNFVVVWEVNNGNGISGQRYSSSGTALGSEFFVVPPCLPCNGHTPSVAADSPGDFVVVWRDNFYGTDWILGQRYASSGAPLGGVFRVNTYGTNSQTEPAVAADASGDFVVVWTSAGQDGSGAGVFGQRFLDTGAPSGPEFRVNTYTTQGQSAPAVAADPLGHFVVAWSSWQDGSFYGIFAQRYDMIVPVELTQFRVE